MAERLLIKNFAGLNVDLELGRVTLFTGPQASGKSVCTKCIYLFRSFIPTLLNSATSLQEKAATDKAFLEKFRAHFPNLWQSEEGFQLRYETGEAFVEITGEAKSAGVSASLTYSPFLQETAAEMRRAVRNIREARKVVPGPAGLKTESESLNDIFLQEYLTTNELRSRVMQRANVVRRLGPQAFIIAGRAFLSTLKGSIMTVLASSPVTDPLLREFIQLYETVRRSSQQEWAVASGPVTKLVAAIMRGTPVMDDDDDYVELTDGRRIPLTNASSGQQEVFSLLLILRLLSNPTLFAYSNLYAEEPEAHLFPESQRVLTQLMARVYNSVSYPIQYVITTHSPYLLASFNNLVYAHQLQLALADDPTATRKLNRIVPKAERLPLADVRAYGLENGQARPLINHEVGLVSADLLDSASDQISQQFEKLMALDPSTR